MKKGLLLSVVASTMIFAGGDIAPVEPAAPASADFWGQIGFAYQAQDFNKAENGGKYAKYAFGDKDNNNFSASVVLGVEKQIAYGFGFGVELAGWTDFGLNIADKPRVASDDPTSAEISQAYLTYTFGNTAIKAGRQALPKAVSPWAWSDRTAGVLDNTFEGVVIANTDLTDTTLVGAWIKNVTNDGETAWIGRKGKFDGLYMLALINKSIANTTVSLSGYYVPKFGFEEPKTADLKSAYSVWGTVESKYDNLNVGLQAVVADSKYPDTKTTFGIAGKVGSTFGDFDAQLIAGYINNGDTTLNLGGTSAFWTDNEMAGDISPYHQSQWAILAAAGYKLPVGKIYGTLGYWDYNSPKNDYEVGYDKAWGARVGYKFTVAGVNAKVEYRYRDISWTVPSDASKGNDKRQRIRVEAYYKF